jgi:hypothetical protein
VATQPVRGLALLSAVKYEKEMVSTKGQLQRNPKGSKMIHHGNKVV